MDWYKEIRRDIFAFPVWVIMRIMRRFLPKDHPWKYKRFSFGDWSKGATPLCLHFGMMLGFSTINLVAVFIVIIFR